MRLRSRVEAIERRQSPTGECGCNGRNFGEMLLCRDPSVPPPPRNLCARCGRPLSRLILGPVAKGFGNPAYEPADNGTIRRMALGAYEPANADTIRAMMAPPAYEPADFRTIEWMMAPSGDGP
jgi:hypothetical protein